MTPTPKTTRGDSKQEQINQAMARLWEKHKSAVMGRLVVIEEAASALRERFLSNQLKRHAEKEAHNLSGSAATFGFAEGSRLAHDIELMLQPGSLLPKTHAGRLSALVAALRQALEGDPTFPAAPSAPEEEIPPRVKDIY